MMKYAEKSYYLDFLISLNFDSFEIRFGALFCPFSRSHSILGLGHFIRSQSMLEKQIWINWGLVLEVLDCAINWPFSGLSSVGILTKVIFQSIRSQLYQKGEKILKMWYFCESGLWFDLYGLYRASFIFIWFNHDNNLWTIFPNSWHCGIIRAIRIL